MRREAVRLAILLQVVVFQTVSYAQHFQERYIFDEKTGQFKIREELTAVEDQTVAAQALKLLTTNEPAKAERLLKKHFKANPQARQRPDLLLMYADCRLARGDYYKAHKRYQQILDEFVGTREYAQAILREVAVADAFLAGRKRWILGIIPVSAEDEALEILTQVEQLGAGHRVAEVALRKKADYYYRTGQYELAELTYARLASEYPRGRYKCLAMYRSAESALASFPGVAYDDSALIEARERFLQYQQACPRQAAGHDIPLILQQIEAKQAHKQFEVARFYQRTRKPHAAAFYYRYVANTWPDSLWGSRARSELVKLGYLTADSDRQPLAQEPGEPM